MSGKFILWFNANRDRKASGTRRHISRYSYPSKVFPQNPTTEWPQRASIFHPNSTESIRCFSSCACWQIALPKTQWLTSKSIFRKGFWKSLDIFLETNLISKTLWDERAYESKIEGNLKFGGQKCSSRNTVWPCWAFHHLVTCSINVYILWFLLSQNFLFTDVPTMTLQHCLFERKQYR